MNWLPRYTILGELRLLETFAYYDGPRLFSCASNLGQNYLAIWVEEEEEHDVWLYMPISPSRLSSIRSGGISLRSSILYAEGFIYEVHIPDDEELIDTIPFAHSGPRIKPDWLPAPNRYIKLKTETLEPATSADELSQTARAEHRGRLRVEIDPSNEMRSTAPTRSVGRLLIQLQNTLDGLGLSILEEEGGTRGKIPGRVTKETTSEVVGLSAASFVIDLAAANYDDLHGSVFARCAETIVHLFDAEASSGQLQQLISPLHPRAVTGFRKLLSEISNLNGPATIATASSKTEYTAASLTNEQIDKLLQTLTFLAPDQQEEPITGKMYLLGGQVEKQTFEVRPDGSDVTYRGYIDEQAIPGFLNSPLGSYYYVRLNVSSTTDEFTNDKKYTYRLMQITDTD
ncbi:DUF6575 domain-containing protein [Rhodococcus chondri]|uniref:DUF6575 domain-containing protein n=1 Tax=Rhodococcus chondri TaxID=3065941 RepID=A0ABU7JUD7_9NOCA|nr:DUF6575 domain-containing protein [Rhodococcus sp. CC-R104]MEE2033630.1 hypothetical protein [Rhodococcus sp. CC-R104]